ncbi:MAG: MarR family transcriptional regulator [Solirubrobacterales bacterium]
MPSDPKPTEQIPLSGLLDIALEALLIEFRADLEVAGYSDIRPTHGCVFRFVREDGMRLTELATLAGMTKQSAGEVVDDLADRGYVERIPDPDDRRAKLIRLTSKGEMAQRVGYRLFAEIEARWAERFGPDRLARMRELLEEVASTEAPHLVPELSRASRSQLAGVRSRL